MSESSAPNTPARMWISLLKRAPETGTFIRLGFWLHAAPERRRYMLDELRRIEDDPTGQLSELQRTVERLYYGTYLAETDSANTGRLGRTTALAASLAALTITAGAALAYASNSDRAYSTEIGGMETVPLSDGSVVELNTNTRIRVQFTRAQRQIELVQGEAHFAVAHDSERPFVVKAGHATFRAAGTEFGVRLYGSTTAGLVVDEGRVATAAQSGSAWTFWKGEAPTRVTVVIAGQAALSDGNGIRVQSLEPQKLRNRGAWRDGWISFEGMPLRDAVAELGRYNSRQVLADDPAIADLKITGRFKTTGVDSFLKALEIEYGIRANADDGGRGLRVIHLRRAEP